MRRSKRHDRVILKAGEFRIVGSCWSKRYETYSACYTFEQKAGKDAMGVARWEILPDDRYRRMLLRIAETLDRRRR